MINEKSCGAIVYHQQKDQINYLLIRHVNGGHWAFPKGHVEPAEKENQTALREIREETGLDVDINTDFREVVAYTPKEGYWKEVVYFLAESEEIHVQQQIIEVTDFAWLSYDEALNQLTYDNDRHLLKKASDYLSEKHL